MSVVGVDVAVLEVPFVNDILADLYRAQARGVYPPQDWVERAICAIEDARYGNAYRHELRGNCPRCSALIYLDHAHICNTERA